MRLPVLVTLLFLGELTDQCEVMEGSDLVVDMDERGIVVRINERDGDKQAVSKKEISSIVIYIL